MRNWGKTITAAIIFIGANTASAEELILDTETFATFIKHGDFNGNHLRYCYVGGEDQSSEIDLITSNNAEISDSFEMESFDELLLLLTDRFCQVSISAPELINLLPSNRTLEVPRNNNQAVQRDYTSSLKDYLYAVEAASGLGSVFSILTFDPPRTVEIPSQFGPSEGQNQDQYFSTYSACYGNVSWVDCSCVARLGNRNTGMCSNEENIIDSLVATSYAKLYTFEGMENTAYMSNIAVRNLRCYAEKLVLRYPAPQNVREHAERMSVLLREIFSIGKAVGACNE